MQNRQTILRCTIPGEDLWLPRDRYALICDADHLASDGYAAYLLTGDAAVQRTQDSRRVVVPAEDYEAGDFLILSAEEDGRPVAKRLPTADKPERTLFLTGQCNSNCIMCPYSTKQRVSGYAERLEDLLAYVELMSPDTDYVCITGGEPTLLKDGFLTVLESVKNHLKCALVHILTNGRTFSYEDFFAAYQRVRPYQTLLGIPIHAPTAPLHDQISGVSGSFRQTVRGIENCYKAKEHIELRVVTSALNARQLKDLAKFIGQNFPAVSCVSLMGLEMMGNAMINRDQVWIGYDQLMPYVEEAADILLSYGVAPRLFNYPFCKVSHRLQSIYHRSITESKIRYKSECESCARKRECGGFFQTTIVMPDITVTPFAGRTTNV